MVSGTSGKSPWIISILNAINIIAWLKKLFISSIFAIFNLPEPTWKMWDCFVFLFHLKRGKCKLCMLWSNFSPAFPSSKWFCGQAQCLCNLLLATCREVLQKFMMFSSAAPHRPQLGAPLPSVCWGPSVKAVKVIILQDKCWFPLKFSRTTPFPTVLLVNCLKASVHCLIKDFYGQ